MTRELVANHTFQMDNGHKGKIAYVAENGNFVVNDTFCGDFIVFDANRVAVKMFKQSLTSRDRAVRFAEVSK